MSAEAIVATVFGFALTLLLAGVTALGRFAWAAQAGMAALEKRVALLEAAPAPPTPLGPEAFRQIIREELRRLEKEIATQRELDIQTALVVHVRECEARDD